ncbi:hypothetical protein PVK74_10635 [Micromonospora chalcea]|uniref:hypothetical protein n=1 Tax=Micromonospora chalcea TaxID=1874 RepID=UPI002378ED52|nr:hypothetical protein [Micromonospora chalcea]WDQ02231.1 hypothetical protein PVK74_10635 [Micromonospora chalcea]
MTTPNIPNIPLQLAGRPTIGGLVVPWTTARTPDGRHRFGTVDLHRHNRALTDLLCQTCGAQLGARIVFAMRDSDLRLLTSPEPGMHPVCAAYSATACPMLAGRMNHYRTTSLAEQLADLGALSQGDPTSQRAGAPAEPWQLVWATGYRPFTNPLTHQLAALLLPDQILRVRPTEIPSSLNPGTKANPE